MITLKFDKLYNRERIKEPCAVAVPFPKGKLRNVNDIRICKDHKEVISQCKTTSKWEDGTVRWAFVRFQADLPANKSIEYQLYDSNDTNEIEESSLEEQVTVLCHPELDRIVVDTGKIRFSTGTSNGNLFENMIYGATKFNKHFIEGPILTDIHGTKYPFIINGFEIVEEGPVCTIIKGVGFHESDNKSLKAEIKIKAFAGKSDIEIAYRLLNTTLEPFSIGSLEFLCNLEDVLRTCVADSNYKTDYLISESAESVVKQVNAEKLLYEANEHFAEVFYGTMFADGNRKDVGVSATIFQAQQNYPKGVKAGKDGILVMLVPKGSEVIVLQSGMAREQKFLLHFHDANEDLKEINHQSIVYQMPDRPYLDPSVYKEAGVMHDVFVENKIPEVEIALINKADGHSRCYGMLNWGDSPDPGYTTQGRGNGAPVWTNNEYDYPHACALMYARTGIRRFLDYLIVAGRHWMDVDVCHFSDDPLLLGGQWEHTRGHVIGGKIVCSHQWVEGLFDYYHFTGEEEAFRTALGIGHNILRLLDTDTFKQKGEINARETGWAMRSLVAIYKETHDSDWLSKCDWIVGHFEDWEKEYGNWLSPYTDNTSIRVPFMISIAVGSLMRYYRIRPKEKVKQMILRAVNDLIQNCYMEYGVFYYKELPSLNRLGNNTIVLEALTIAYELTGDTSYLEYGRKTFESQIGSANALVGGMKKNVGDAIIGPGPGTKNFGQSFIPMVSYYKAIADKK